MPEDLRTNEGKTVAAAPADDWRPGLSHLTAAGRYEEAIELIERRWVEAPLRGAYGALALAVLAREGRFDLLDRLAARGEGSRGPVLRNEIAYQLGLLSVSTKVQPAFAQLFADAGSRIAERTLVDLRGSFEAGREQEVWLRSALVDTLALCLVGACRPAEALAQLELLDETGLSNPERGAVACTRSMALASAGDRKAARAARGEAGVLGADQRLMDAADGVITSRRLPKVEVGDPRGWAGLAIVCAVLGWLTASVGQGASSVQRGFAVAAVVAIPFLSLAVHELVHVLAARAQGLRVLAVRFNGTKAQTRVAMPLGPHLSRYGS